MDPNAPYNAAGICYSCSISCHGEHSLVELFTRRNFVCDCGTTRFSGTSPCVLRAEKGQGVKGEVAAGGNTYNQNFANRFCGCGEVYDAQMEKGTMFQCIGLGTAETGGCGEDWWHPECLVGLPRGWSEGKQEDKEKDTDAGENKPAEGEAEGEAEAETEAEPPLPPGFPAEDGFDSFICYKCVESNPWIKRYAGTAGFLPPVRKHDTLINSADEAANGKKRKLDDADDADEADGKRFKEESDEADGNSKEENEPAGKRSKETNEASAEAVVENPHEQHKHESLSLPDLVSGTFSLFLQEDFRTHLCHCATCFPLLKPHVQLREEEDVYEPPLSDAGSVGQSQGTSLFDRGSAALSNVDRVRAIEGVMVYNHLKDKVKQFLTPFAESGEAVSAEAIKGYFEALRGDEGGISEAAAQARGGEKQEGV